MIKLKTKEEIAVMREGGKRLREVVKQLRPQIEAGKTTGQIDKEAREEGMISLKQDGYLKALEGITTVEEVLRVAQE